MTLLETAQAVLPKNLNINELIVLTVQCKTKVYDTKAVLCLQRGVVL